MIHDASYRTVTCWSCGTRGVLVGTPAPSEKIFRTQDVLPTVAPKQFTWWLSIVLVICFPILPFIALPYVWFKRAQTQGQTDWVYDPVVSNKKHSDTPGFDTGWVARESVINRGDVRDMLYDPRVKRWLPRSEVFICA